MSTLVDDGFNTDIHICGNFIMSCECMHINIVENNCKNLAKNSLKSPNYLSIKSHRCESDKIYP